jgi:hypothetical protein
LKIISATDEAACLSLALCEPAQSALSQPQLATVADSGGPYSFRELQAPCDTTCDLVMPYQSPSISSEPSLTSLTFAELEANKGGNDITDRLAKS